MNYDVIVVGAGSAGCVLASRLSEDPKRSVLLLEAGRDYPDLEKLPPELMYATNPGGSILGSAYNWGTMGKANARQSKPLHAPRGKVIGGSSSINGPIFRRGVPEDYDTWAAKGNSEWTFAKVLPYFKKLERDIDFQDGHHGTNGPMPVHRDNPRPWAPYQTALQQAARDMGIPEDPDMNSPASTGIASFPVNTPDGRRMSTARAYLAQARLRPNLRDLYT